jgi:DnaK suppressor protein
MTKTQLKALQEQLRQIGKRLKGEVSTLATEALQKTGGAGSGNLSDTPVHPADLASDNYEQDVALSLLENQEHRLEEVADALERIRQGTFGRCEGCGRDISIERLKVLPFTRHCVRCSEQAQSRSVPGNL